MLTRLSLLIGSIWENTTDELRDFNIAGIIAIAGLYSLSFLQWVTAGKISSILTLLGVGLLVTIAMRIISISKATGITLLGEFAEVAQAIANQKGPSNALIKLYYNILVQIFIALAILITVLPHIPLGNAWWLWLAWPTLLILLAIGLGSQDGKALRSAGVIFFVIILGYTIHITWPGIWNNTPSIPTPFTEKETPDTASISGLVRDVNGRQLVRFRIPKKYQGGHYIYLDEWIDGVVVGRNPPRNISETNNRGTLLGVGLVEFRLSQKTSAKKIKATFVPIEDN